MSGFKSSISLAILTLNVFISWCPRLVACVGCTYYPYYPNSYTTYITTCTGYCCSTLYPTTPATACCSSSSSYNNNSSSSYSTLWWIAFPIVFFVIALIFVFIFICCVKKKQRWGWGAYGRPIGQAPMTATVIYPNNAANSFGNTAYGNSYSQFNNNPNFTPTIYSNPPPNYGDLMANQPTTIQIQSQFQQPMPSLPASSNFVGSNNYNRY